MEKRYFSSYENVLQCDDEALMEKYMMTLDPKSLLTAFLTMRSPHPLHITLVQKHTKAPSQAESQTIFTLLLTTLSHYRTHQQPLHFKTSLTDTGSSSKIPSIHVPDTLYHGELVSVSSRLPKFSGTFFFDN